MKKILITGATGLIGSELSIYLSNRNFEVTHLTRKRTDNKFKSFTWNIENNFIAKGALDNVDYIIHLAGAGIADKRWSEKRKQEIIESRVKSSELLFNSVNKLDRKPKAFISASAIGYYGAVTGNKVFTEENPPANDFLGTVCKLWESSSKKFESIGIRTVQLRLGVVLSSKGGALKKMMLPTKFGLGSALGSGKQFLLWVHINDVIQIFEKSIIDNNLTGPYNVVSPSYTTYNDFSRILAEVMNKPFFIPNVPSFLLKLVLGEMSQIILEGSRISSEKIINAGYNFKYPTLNEALKNLSRRKL